MGGEVNVAHLSGKDPGSDMGGHDSRYRDKGEPPRCGCEGRTSHSGGKNENAPGGFGYDPDR